MDNQRAEAIQTWVKCARQDLHFLKVHFEEHATKLMEAQAKGDKDQIDYWSSIVERAYRRISEFREVIVQQEAELQKTRNE
jgi:hypothetical protein